MTDLNEIDPDVNFFEVYNNCAYFELDTPLIDYLKDDNDSLGIYHINIRSSRKNLDELLIVLNKFKVYFPVIVLSETWLNSEADWQEVPGYRAFHSIRATKKGGGVTILVDDKLHADSIGELTINYNGVFESVALNLTVCDSLFKIIAVYRPPSDSISMFNNIFFGMLENHGIVKNTVLVGDFNIDILPDDLPGEVNTFMDEIRANNFLPLISLPTRVTDSTATCIDHVYFNSFSPCKYGVITTSISDHYSIFISIPIVNTGSNNSHQLSKLKSIRFRDLSMKNCEAFRAEVLDLMQSFESFDLLSINDRFKLFDELLFKAYNKHCPIRSKTISVKRFLCPWMTKSLLRSINNKHYLYRQSRINSEYLELYKMYKNYLSRVTKNAKQLFYNNKFEEYKGNIKKTWQTLHSVLRPNNSKTRNFKIELPDGATDDHLKISNAFNVYFSSCADNLASSIPSVHVTPSSYVKSVRNSFVFLDTSETEVANTILSFKSKGSPLNTIPSFIFKQIAYIIAPVLAKLINVSVSEGIFPNCLKVARVIPLHKSGVSTILENFRPISTLHFLSKIFERIVHDKLSSFFHKYRVLSEHQFGFRKGRSTCDAILNFTQQCHSALNNKLCLISVFLDFSKAFDTVDHSILLAKLEMCGVRGNLRNWFKSYLQNRLQYVDINETFSDTLTVANGVPQGSILGPLLFLIYINDMCNSSDRLNFVHFADDSTVYLQGDNIVDLTEVLNVELNKVFTWLCANKLSLNASKCAFTVFTNKKHVVPLLKINNHPITFVNEIKFLGVLIDSRLNFEHHINEICNKLSKCCALLKRLSDFLPPRILRQIYLSLAYPYLVYSVEVWGSSCKTKLNRLKSIQNRMVKIIDPNTTCISTSYLDNKILSFEDIYKYFCLRRFHKYFHTNSYPFFREMFENLETGHSYQTRFVANNNLNSPFVHTSNYLRSFVYQASKF